MKRNRGLSLAEALMWTGGVVKVACAVSLLLLAITNRAHAQHSSAIYGDRGTYSIVENIGVDEGIKAIYQQGGIPSQACNQPATAVSSSAGNVAIVNNSGDQTILLCSITAQVTQGATPANYQLQACRNSSCTDSYPITPLLPGHANLFDTYNLPPNQTAQIVLRRGYGLYLTLSGTAQAVVQVIYGAY